MLKNVLSRRSTMILSAAIVAALRASAAAQSTFAFPATATGTAASDVLSNARELDNQSGMLRNAVDGFLAKVRAA